MPPSSSSKPTTKASSASLISTLQRAQFGIATLSGSSDKEIADLLAAEAKKKEKIWQEYGLGAAYGAGSTSTSTRSSPGASAGRNLATNKKFLSSMIRSVDDHNQTLLRQQAAAARGSLKAGRVAGQRGYDVDDPPRRHYEESSSSARRGGGGSKSGMRAWDDEDRNEKRRDPSGGEERDRDRNRSSRGDRDRSPSRERSSRRRRDDDDEGDHREHHRSSRRRRDRSHSRTLRSDTDSEAEEERRRRRRREKRRVEDKRSDDDDKEERRQQRRRRRDDDDWDSRTMASSTSRQRSASPEGACRSEATAVPSSSRANDHSNIDADDQEPDVGPPLPPVPSRMDKYFADDYDPRLDVAPPPKTGLVGDGWERMLEAMREKEEEKRRAKKREKKAAEKAERKAIRKKQKMALGFLSSSDSDSSDTAARKRKKKEEKEAKKKESKKPEWLSQMEQRERDIMSMQYSKRGETKAWDVGKLGVEGDDRPSERNGKRREVDSEEEDWEKKQFWESELLKGFED